MRFFQGVFNRVSGGDQSIKRGTWLALASIVVARLVVQLFLYRLGFIALTADDFGRAVAAGIWAQHPYLALNNLWLPFHMFLVGSILRLVWDLLWVPRLVNILLGVASIFLSYGVGLALFGDRRIGIAAAFILAFNPTHLWLSSAMSVEVPYLALVLGCGLSFVHFLQTDRYRWLFLSAGLLGLANGFRIEGWLISMVFSGYLLWAGGARLIRRQGGLPSAALLWAAAALPMLFPILWMGGFYLRSGDPLYFLSMIKVYKLTWYGPQSSFFNYLEYAWQFDRLTLLLMLPGVAYALYRCREFRALRWFLAISLLPLVLFVGLHGGQAEPPGNYIRYLTPFLSMVSPLLGLLLVALLDHSKQLVWLRALWLSLLLLGLFYQMQHTFQYKNDPSAQGLAVGQYLRQQRQDHPELAAAPAIIELSYWEFLAVHVGANDLTTLMYDRALQNSSHNAPSLIVQNPQVVRLCSAQYGVKYVLVKAGQLKQVLEGDLELAPQARINDYFIYFLPSGFSSGFEGIANGCTLPFGYGD